MVAFVCTKETFIGLENYPRHSPALVVMNHLGDLDTTIVMVALPDSPEVNGKIELCDIAKVRLVAEMYVVIWIHRDQPDRCAISTGLEALHQGCRILISPEGRESTGGRLEVGTEGDTTLAIKVRVPVVPSRLLVPNFDM
jgi:1-acyl-sn-glycerol-3-phosphate acyltransferase